MVATPRPMTLPVESGHSPGLIPIPGESRIVIRHIGWHVYKCLSEAIGEGRHVRLAYDGKALEIMVTSYLHEHFKQLLNKVLAAVMLALGIDHLDGGETTWDTEESERGLQADLSYYFDREKICVAREALARQSQNPADSPSPDLAVEIDISRPKVDRPSIYARRSVSEVWRFTGVTLVIEQLQGDGSYAVVQASRFIPVPPAEIVRWLRAEDATLRIACGRRLQAWAAALRPQV